MTKEELARSIVIPDAIKNDKHEHMTQEEFTEGLIGAIKSLALSMSEIQDIKDNKVSIGELRATISNGRNI